MGITMASIYVGNNRLVNYSSTVTDAFHELQSQVAELNARIEALEAKNHLKANMEEVKCHQDQIQERSGQIQQVNNIESLLSQTISTQETI